MKRLVLTVSISLVLLPEGGAAANEMPRVLEPTSQWVLEFAEERCSLIREFTEGENRMRLQIDSYGPNPGYRVTISGDLVAGSAAAPLVDFRVAYSPDSGEREAMRTFAGQLVGERAVSFGPGFLRDGPWAEARSPDFERSVTHLTFAFEGRQPFRLETGSMAAPFETMAQCIDDLLTSWGIDPAEHRARTRPPTLIELPEGYRTVKVDLDDKYPSPTERRYRPQAEAQARERIGPVPKAGYVYPIRMMIDAEGHPTACVLQTEITSEAAREKACKTFAGLYQPALDAEGRPMASFVQLGL